MKTFAWKPDSLVGGLVMSNGGLALDFTACSLCLTMEVHLRKITRCLGRAVGELEAASASEKTAGEVSGQQQSLTQWRVRGMELS